MVERAQPDLFAPAASELDTAPDERAERDAAAQFVEKSRRKRHLGFGC
jgi:hypothetical protein